MIRVKFIKNYKQYKKDDVQVFSPNEAFGLIDSGCAIVSKDIAEQDTFVTQTPTTFKKRKNIKEK